MTAVWIALSVLSLIATVILSNLMWSGLREARAFVAIIDSPGFLEKAFTAEFLTSVDRQNRQLVDTSKPTIN
jgi:hypothetical protein